MVTPPSLPHHVVVLLTRDELPNNDAATSKETIVDINRNEETKDKIKVTMNILLLLLLLFVVSQECLGGNLFIIPSILVCVGAFFLPAGKNALFNL